MTMKNLAFNAAIAACLVTASAYSAHADSSRARGGESYEHRLSVGLSLGEPTGLTVRVGLGRSALVVAAGLDFDGHQHLHMDYVGNLLYLSHTSDAVVPIYLGVGWFVKDHPDEVGRHAGIRVPLGVQIDFRAPIQLYGEVVPHVVLIEPDEINPHTKVAVDGAIGIRARF